MIRHIVLFSLKAETSLEATIEQLSRLGTIPGSTVFQVKPNLKVDQIGNAIDVVVYAEFPGLEALNAYKQHSLYAAVTATVQPTRELRFAADVEG